jgi:hypothetical protein
VSMTYLFLSVVLSSASRGLVVLTVDRGIPATEAPAPTLSPGNITSENDR